MLTTLIAPETIPMYVTSNNLPLRFASAVDFEGIKTKTHCLGKECEWFLEEHCSVRIIAAELFLKEKRVHRGPSVE
jgi:hypothetical protein